MNSVPLEGVLLVDKPAGRTSFSVVAAVRKMSGQKKVGHAGTLDPFATGLLVLLLGKTWTKKAGLFLGHDKEYVATLQLGQSTDTYDCEGKVVCESEVVPSEKALFDAIQFFQGTYEQEPPMFSAKKHNGTRLYEFARKGIFIERKKSAVQIETEVLSYTYPEVSVRIKGSTGTYVRSIAHDLGERLGCFAHVTRLNRIRSGSFFLKDAMTLEELGVCTREEFHEAFVDFA